MTARENILMPLLLDKVRPDETQLMRIAGCLGLEDRLSHLPHELSGGQQQRVAVARALIAGPDILFADEPTGNLDSKSGGEVMEMLCTIRKSLGKTLILITHDKQLAEMAERRFTIVDGVLREVTEA
ncbi:MAG: ABC transporter ATP-binding protein [Eisenbergiella sp.]